MYLQPWQIFFGGIICGIIISVIVLITIILRIAYRSGVRIEREDKEEKDNG